MNKKLALQKLLEVADLVRMLEDLTSPTLNSTLSPSALGGIRVTLRHAREAILTSHQILESRSLENRPSEGRVDEITSSSRNQGEEDSEGDFEPSETPPPYKSLRSQTQVISTKDQRGNDPLSSLESEPVEFVMRNQPSYGTKRATLRSTLS
jgi:hypothetical protein